MLACEAFQAGRTPAIVANLSFEIVAFNRAFRSMFDIYEDKFIDSFGEDATPDNVRGHPLDVYLEGTGYRRSLRKTQCHEAQLDIDGLILDVSVSKLDETHQSCGGYLLEWYEPQKSHVDTEATEIHAVAKVVDGLGAARTVEEAASAALIAVREAFGWAYGSYWRIDTRDNVLRFECDDGRVNDAFHLVTATATFSEGVGLSGRTWRARDLVFVPDLGEVRDCCRRESAQQAGVKSGVCFPIISGSDVVGTMDFFTLEVLEPSASRLETLRTVGKLVSRTMEKLAATERQTQVAEEAIAFRYAADSSSNALMLTDSDMVIRYINKAARKMLLDQETILRSSLPGFSVEKLVGTNIDDFHQNPAHQRRILGDSRNFPYFTRVRIADLSFELIVNALEEKGEVKGLVAEWRDVSAEVEAQGCIEELLSSASAGMISERLKCDTWQGFTKTIGDGMNKLLGAVQEPLQEATRVTKALSKGDLTQSASQDMQGEFAEVAGALNESIVNLREVISRIVYSGEQIGRAASELADGNAHLNGRTQQQAAALEETAATIEQLTGTVKQNASNAQEANKLAADARDLAERGGEVVGRAVSAMAEINRASKKISDIISVIDEIAFQTNLLALNAAVEAARAGEQGRGFAVVATEVRNLAQRSAGAAKEIKALIKDSVEKVEDGSNLVDSSGQTLREIVGGVKRVSELIAEIAAASEEQATGIEQVNKAVAQMDEMTQQNAAMVEEATSASSSMHQQAQALGEMVGRFQLGEGVNAAAPSEKKGEPKTPKRPPLPRSEMTSSKPVQSQVSDDDDWDEF